MACEPEHFSMRVKARQQNRTGASRLPGPGFVLPYQQHRQSFCYNHFMATVYVPPITQRTRITQEAIDDVVRQIAEKFHPQKIILFGSYARGNPRPESDVDLLVVMDGAEKKRRPSLEIRQSLGAMFGLDLIVYSPKQLKDRLEMEDWFLRDAVETGKVVYEAHHA
jgi:predicted nucleotidyltransferase